MNIDRYCENMLAALRAQFGENLCYMGLQGSYLRGEATENSDIDVVVILQTLTVAELDAYRRIVEALGNADKSCGFICSRTDMQRWNPLESCQFLHDTRDLYGKLADFVPPWTIEDEINHIKLSANNLYHALCHGYIHGARDKLARKLPAYYKAAYFIVQNLHFLRTYRAGCAEFILPKAELLQKLSGEERRVLQAHIDFLHGAQADVDTHFPLLLRFCQNAMAAV